MRHAFVTSLCEQAKRDKRIFLLTGDLGYRFLERFADQFPDRFLNVGVAEANLITVAAGLSTSGFVPFVYSIATFLTMRPFEQIRDDVSLQNLNVKLVGVGAGLAYTKAGPTHHSMEDITLMRTLPNMAIIAPADPSEMGAATGAAALHKGPMYLRLERNPMHPPVSPDPFVLGKGRLYRKGKKIAIVATGTKVELAMEVAQLLSAKGIEPAVFGFPTIKPLDTRLLQKIGKTYSVVTSIEEHRIDGGLGTALIEFFSSQTGEGPTVLRFGLKNEFSPISANYETLMQWHGLTPQAIAKALVKKLTR